MSHWKRIMNEDTHLLLITKNKNAPKYQNIYQATQMEHDQSSYFCRGPDDFCLGPAPVGPTLVTGLANSQSITMSNSLLALLCNSGRLR